MLDSNQFVCTGVCVYNCLYRRLCLIVSDSHDDVILVLALGQHKTVFDGIGIGQVCYTSINSVNCV